MLHNVLALRYQLKLTSRFIASSTFIILLNISNTYAGEWATKHYGIKMKFGDKTWSVVHKSDNKDDAQIALFDKSDGSSFFVRVEHVEGAGDINDSVIEQSMGESLYSSDPKTKVTNRGKLKVAKHEFYSVDYQFRNKKFGRQIVKHAFLKRSNHIVMLLLSWPEKDGKMPNKHLNILKDFGI